MVDKLNSTVNKGRGSFVKKCPYVPPVRPDGSLGHGRYQGKKRIREFRCPGGTGDACRSCNSRENPETGERPSQPPFIRVG